jgi:hypothetical protein
LNNLGWKLFNALFPRTLESFARRFARLMLQIIHGSQQASHLFSTQNHRQFARLMNRVHLG